MAIIKKSFWKKVVQELLDLIFPVICLGCNQEGNWICSACLAKIPFYQKPICPWCEKSMPAMKLCLNCQKLTLLDSLFVVTSYQNVLLQELLHNLKYNFAWKISESLLPLIDNFFTKVRVKQNSFFSNCSSLLVMPIPLHKKRLRERGFNQSELLASLIAKSLAVKTLPNVLVRKRNTISQMTLNRKERLINVQDAFECLDPEQISEKRILIVDDVLTTGATIKEAALTLRKAGCSSVGALVLAKEELTRHFSQKVRG